MNNRDIICFSHLRWNFVYQRPQHLMKRFATNGRVFFIEEPVLDAVKDECEITQEIIGSDKSHGLYRVVFHLQGGLSNVQISHRQQYMLDSLVAKYKISSYYAWYYSPMALEISSHLTPQLIIYDCMDELSAFKFAPPILRQKELELLSIADIVFTGGHHLYNAKKHLHNNMHPFPSSIDKEHFFKARQLTETPGDQQKIPAPRLGFYGVLDERMDLGLIAEMAALRPNWQFVYLGPVVKIDPATLPKKSNIHYPGNKSYDELPAYLAGWDLCIMPFIINESTEFISPTKTPEFLSAGKPVISTAIKDVVSPYAEQGLVHIAHNATEFIAVAEKELNAIDKKRWLEKVDLFLANISWDKTWEQMHAIINETAEKKFNSKKAKSKIYV